jgi:uncharacterized protein YerC
MVMACKCEGRMTPRLDTPRQHDRDERDLRVCEMLDAGYSYAEITAETGASKSVIAEIKGVLNRIDGVQDGRTRA